MRTLILLLSAVLFFVVPAGAQERPAAGYELYGTQVENLRSASKLDYRLYISLPRQYKKCSDSYPLLVVLDADYTFAIVHSIARLLTDHGELPPMIIVGVAYPGVAEEGYGPLFKRSRTRDYTPTFVPDGGYGAEYQKLSGGADRFLNFIAGELCPHLERKFRVKAGDRSIVGYSYGGLLASYALLTRPGLFRRFVIISPSLWYDDHMIVALEKKQRAVLKASSARAFFAVGGRETGVRGERDMVSDLSTFVGNLRRNRPALPCQLWVADGETHHSVFPAAAMRGLRWVFSGEPIPKAH